MTKRAALAALLFALPTGAAAEAAFSTEEAARCGVVFARMADALSSAPDAPDVLVRQVAIGLPIWEYELIASAPGEEAKLNAAVSKAIDDLLENMPNGEDDAAKRGDYLLAQAQACGRMIDAAYPAADHPILAEIKSSQAVEPSAVPVPSEKPKADTRKRGLR